MFNKLQFNNLVVSNKKILQQARTQTIQKIVQKLRKLKQTQDKKPEDGRTKELSRKYKECVDELKKLKCLDMVKRILVLDKNPTAILTNGLSTPEEIAIASLAINKKMQATVKCFKEDLKLDKADASWKMEIMDTSKRQIKINRTAEKREKRKALKEQKVLERKRSDWLRENKPVVEPPHVEESSLIRNVADIIGNTWKEEQLSNEMPTIGSGRPTSNKANKSSKIKSRTDPKEASSQKNLKVTLQISSSDDKVGNEAVENKEQLRGELETDINADVTHVVDPFFITDTGENYLSTVVPIVNDSLESTDKQLDEPIISKGTPQLRSVTPCGRTIKNKAREINAANILKKPKQVSDVSNERLHPSWAAKMKTRPIITNFRGKRITFEDSASELFAGKASVAHIKGSEKSSENEKLHPSWAAKLKTRPIIANFQGKKIIFDDSEGSAAYNNRDTNGANNSSSEKKFENYLPLT